MTAVGVDPDVDALKDLDFNAPCTVIYPLENNRQCDLPVTHQATCPRCKATAPVCDTHAKQCYKPSRRGYVRCGACGRRGAQIVRPL